MSLRFDIALSFAGADRSTAEEVRDSLVAAQFSVFYDRDYEHEMLGQDGTLYLRRIYSRDSRYCVVLISKHYDSREWTQLEREAIQARELKGERGVLIPVKLDHHSPGWLPASRIHFDLSSRPLTDLVRLLKARKELDNPGTSQSISPLASRPINVAGVWHSLEVISGIHQRQGIIRLHQHGDELSGKAELTESFSHLKKHLVFDLHGSIDAAAGTIRFTSALDHADEGDLRQYSVDRFTGRILPDGTRIEGTCTDERGISAKCTLTRTRDDT
jgi:TIR domain